MPGWWFTVESTTTKHLLRQFKAAIRAALASKQSARARMRARSALQRFPVAHWKELLATMHETAIKVNQKSAIKNGLELRGEYNTSLASSALPSSNSSAVSTPPHSSFSVEDAVAEEDEAIGDLPEGTLSPLDEGSPTGRSRKLSLGVRTGPGAVPPLKASKPRIQRRTHLGEKGEKGESVSPRTSNNQEKRRTYISHMTMSSDSSRSASPIQKQSKKRDTLVRMSIARAFARFGFGEPDLDSRSGPRLTGDSEKPAKDGQVNTERDREEVLVTAEQARADKKKSMIASQLNKTSFRKSSATIQPPKIFQHHKPSVAQEPSDAYLTLIGKTRKDRANSRAGSRLASTLTSAPPHTPTQVIPVTPEFPTSSVQASSHSSNLRTSVMPEIPASSVARDFAASSSTAPSTQARITTTFETRRGTITFGAPGGVTSIEHPVVDSHRFSYGTVLQGKKDYALQNVEPFFTDPTGLYYKAFNAELKDLNSKNSEDALCIEEFLTMSEKDWYNRLHKVKMGKRASRARPATIFDAPLRRQGSVVSIFNENVEAAAVPDNSAEQYLLKEQYQPPSGLKKLLLRRARQWPFYSFLLAFGQIIAANSYQVTLISGQVGQSANKLYAIVAILSGYVLALVVAVQEVESNFRPISAIRLLRSGLFTARHSPLYSSDIQNMGAERRNRIIFDGIFQRCLLLLLELWDVPVATWAFRACVIQGTQQIYVTVLWLWGNHLTKLNAQGVAAFTWQTHRAILTGLTIPIAVMLWAIGTMLFFGLPDYYRQKPGQVPSFYSSIIHRKIIIWFFIAVILQNYFLSAPFGRNWQYLWSSQHAPPSTILLLILLFFILLWALLLTLLARLSIHHSWIIPIAAVGLGCPRWCQILWATSGMGTWIPWAGGPVAQALTGRVLWLWLGVLDAIQGVGFGMILLQTLTRFHVTFTLVAAQVLGSVATMVGRATAPDRDGPGTVFPNLVLEGGEGLKTVGWWTGVGFQVVICVGFLKIFRKEQLQKP
ncbi:MAG: hypothetical protein Q9182_004309 [Xanthomendoza sp. 2 TL-2023]